MKYVTDTGALISLACSRSFFIVLKNDTLIITKEVINEIDDFAQYYDYLGEKAHIIQRNTHQFKVETPKTLLNLKISMTELSVFSLGKEKMYTILTDDIHAARIAKQELRISSKPSFFALLKLYQRKKISKEQLTQDMQLILKERNWLQGVLYEYAVRIIQEMK